MWSNWLVLPMREPGRRDRSMRQVGAGHVLLGRVVRRRRDLRHSVHDLLTLLLDPLRMSEIAKLRTEKITRVAYSSAPLPNTPGKGMYGTSG